MFNHKITKKGNLNDIIDSGLIILGVIIVLFFIFSINTEFNKTIENNEMINGTGLVQEHESFNTKTVKAVDYGILLMAILFPLFSFIASRKIPTNPLMIILVIAVIGLTFLIGMIIANMYGAMLENPQFYDFTTNLIFTPVIIPNYLWYSMIYAFIVLIGLYGKEGNP